MIIVCVCVGQIVHHLNRYFYENLLINSFLIIHHHHHFFRIQINIITIHSFIHSFISDCCLALHFLSFSLFLLLNYSWTKNEIKLILFSFFFCCCWKHKHKWWSQTNRIHCCCCCCCLLFFLQQRHHFFFIDNDNKSL